jgi:hypothetical protein
VKTSGFERKWGAFSVLYVRKIVRGSWDKIACNKDSDIVNSFKGVKGVDVSIGEPL